MWSEHREEGPAGAGRDGKSTTQQHRVALFTHLTRCECSKKQLSTFIYLASSFSTRAALARLLFWRFALSAASLRFLLSWSTSMLSLSKEE